MTPTNLTNLHPYSEVNILLTLLLNSYTVVRKIATKRLQRPVHQQALTPAR